MLGNGSFMLRSGEQHSLTAPTGWLGTWGARTGCQFENSSAGVCETGQCSPRFKCYNANVAPYTQASGVVLMVASKLWPTAFLKGPISERQCLAGEDAI